MTYTAPTITELGNVRDFTLSLNKVGFEPDQYSAVVPIVGSIVPAVR
ncbi:hypothetical protein [Nocardioides sp. Leaf307]|nr:hypothetical protein [Nocardioides sp. Leaf307]